MVFCLVVGLTGCSRQSRLKAREIFKDKQVRRLAIASQKGDVERIDLLLSEGPESDIDDRFYYFWFYWLGYGL